jgi:FixJ family two-component response regulator
MVSCYTELNPISMEITNLAGQGYTDRQIGALLGFSFRTVYRYRHSSGTSSGRSQRKCRTKVQVKKPTYKLLPLDKLVLN